MEVIEVNCDSIFHNLVIKQPSALPSNMSNIGQYWAILGDIRRYWAILGDIGAQSRPALPITLYIALFTTPINLSSWLPHQGARLRLSLHDISCCSRRSRTRSSSLTSFNHLDALTNVDPLSEYIVLARPRRAISRFKHCRNVVVSRLSVSSKCKALERLHEKTTKYLLRSRLLEHRYRIGPAKSVPMTSNAAPPVVRSVGSFRPPALRRASQGSAYIPNT